MKWSAQAKKKVRVRGGRAGPPDGPHATQAVLCGGEALCPVKASRLTDPCVLNIESHTQTTLAGVGERIQTCSYPRPPFSGALPAARTRLLFFRVCCLPWRQNAVVTPSALQDYTREATGRPSMLDRNRQPRYGVLHGILAHGFRRGQPRAPSSCSVICGLACMGGLES